MKRYLLSTIFILAVASFHFSSSAQQNTIFRIKAEGQYGWLLNSSGNVVGGEAALELPLLGNHNWEYTYHFPTVGFALGYLHIDDPDYMRHAINVYPYFHWAIVHTNAFALNMKWGTGTAGMIPDKGTDYDYFPITGMMTAGLNMDIALSTRYGRPLSQWSINLGGNLLVYHNGNVTRKTKNNVLANVEFALKYTPNVWPLPIKHPARSVKHILALEIYGVAGANQLEKNEKFFPNGTINAGVYLPISNAYRLGLSAEAFYNGVFDGSHREENIRYNFIDKDRFRYKIRGGVALANEITTGKVNIGLHTGFYFYNKVRVPKYNEFDDENDNRIENYLYTNLVARYYITPRFFTILELRSHLFHPECMGIGFGWAMPDFGKRLKNPFARISFKKEDKEELRITGSED